MTKLCAFALLATLLLPGCGSGSPEAASSVLTINVSPVPLVVRWGCPQHAPADPPPTQCFLSMDPVVSITESAGVGGHMVAMALSVRDATTQAGLFGITLDKDWIVANAGTDRIEPGATLSFRVVVNNYPLPFAARPNLTLVLGARFLDDRGNELTPGLRVDIT